MKLPLAGLAILVVTLSTVLPLSEAKLPAHHHDALAKHAGQRSISKHGHKHHHHASKKIKTLTAKQTAELHEHEKAAMDRIRHGHPHLSSFGKRDDLAVTVHKRASKTKKKKKKTTKKKTTTVAKATSTTKATAASSSKAVTATTATPSSTCPVTYTEGATTIAGTGTLPKPTAFVKRSGQNLLLNGKNYRMAGPNVYWLGLDENVQPSPSYPDKGRVREAMAIAVAMGANTIRALSLGISYGNSLSLMPSLNTYNAQAWDAIDYAVYAAGQYGLRVIITLGDDYQYYTGGKYTFLRWLGISTGNYGSAFYTNASALNAFRSYIQTFITHKNPYTGLTYAQDPTIIAWETGNEWGAYIGREGYPPLAFTNNIASLIKHLAPNQLIIDGTDGLWNYSTGATAPGLKSSYIDIASDHLYPINTGIFSKDLSLAKSAKKNLLIGEFDWTDYSKLQSYISAVEKTNYVGSMAWSVFGHAYTTGDQCCGAYVQHSDSYSIYYPDGNSAAQQSNILALSQHWHRLTGQTPPKTLKAVLCPQPVLAK
ncbi:glycoside hydrolase family 5 protein [Mixia osmundae IAM 14324]|uniref:mannan endo-1,4-beta-mannosidase n=1 Tax=Mixia osmundae (strain CBS 9802 / IAM 14324 / JCM 22182 / KY 12970) TaxID=764103 RepID=G7DUR4_MIXOS|nr:glycoside hydrolase family 5 protein [Mixia osmundae IAM 14324]KEI37460.1 glycoside hydrolase family 5 protein [Mixia osmundae IAM 14324]GAA94324.1 hypothetical protein E5Q_00974 [Mixia osmundae IAM 14324]